MTPLIDPFGRAITYLRVSVTDRCDLRCIYCMSERMRFLPRTELLSIEELDRLCTAFIQRGVRRLRFTGGEPLVRYRDLNLETAVYMDAKQLLIQELLDQIDFQTLQQFEALKKRQRVADARRRAARGFDDDIDLRAGDQRVGVFRDPCSAGAHRFAHIARGEALRRPAHRARREAAEDLRRLGRVPGRQGRQVSDGTTARAEAVLAHVVTAIVDHPDDVKVSTDTDREPTRINIEVGDGDTAGTREREECTHVTGVRADRVFAAGLLQAQVGREIVDDAPLVHGSSARRVCAPRNAARPVAANL
mgnify:CR=1 FL=1